MNERIPQDQSVNNRLTRSTTNLPYAITITGATLLIVASACLGAFFGFQIGSQIHWLLGAVLVVAAVAGECMKPFAVVAAVSHWKRWEIGRGLALTALATICIIYSLVASLALTATTRGDMVADRAKASAKATVAQDEYDRLKASLADLPAQSTLSNKITTLSNIKGVSCASIGTPQYGPISRKHCPAIQELRDQMTKRSAVEGKLEAAVRKLQYTDGGDVEADPLASSLAAYALALGWEMKVSQLSKWLYLVPVLFVEFGSALGLLLARTFRGVPSEVSQSVPSQETLRETDDDNDDVGTPFGTLDGPLDGTPAKVIELATQHGGKIEGGQRGLAALIGVSKTKLGRALHDLEEAGRVALTVGAFGTRVEVLA